MSGTLLVNGFRLLYILVYMDQELVCLVNLYLRFPMLALAKTHSLLTRMLSHVKVLISYDCSECISVADVSNLLIVLKSQQLVIDVHRHVSSVVSVYKRLPVLCEITVILLLIDSPIRYIKHLINGESSIQ